MNGDEFMIKLIEELKQQIKERDELILEMASKVEFYADSENWFEEKNRNNLYTVIKDDASDDFNDSLRFGGKLARTPLKNQKLLDEIKGKV
jgi:polyribonucleotide nucleotidyltransferase